MYRLQLRTAVIHDFRKIPKQARQRIDAALDTLVRDPRHTGVQKLVAEQAYRLRVGDFRILFEIDDDTRVVTIDRILPRKDAYRQK